MSESDTDVWEWEELRVKITTIDKVVKKMIELLDRCKAGYASAKMGKYTIIITDDEKGAEVLGDAWDKYADQSMSVDTKEENYFIKRDDSLSKISESSCLSEVEKYAAKFAENHGISVREALNRPIVKAYAEVLSILKEDYNG